ncbi:hypothetical protein BCR43DRAFT_485713 [Syncephalastrum racemosum]|uniref:Uncharacterized protein n=1 Tax=Syncephalastrum racemosum TaxID=13706 RepID=A0A1X2HMZ3_SYNRA|nr:hypothetical protein BCR43DRAFT_485713 [Syncephalastrum racemosum]
MSSSKSDPRRPDNIVPYHLPPKTSDDTDYTGNIATIVSMGAIMMRNKIMIVPWIATYFGLSSLLNGRKSLKDDAGWSGAVLAFVSLFTYYLNIYLEQRRLVRTMSQTDEGMGADA